MRQVREESWMFGGFEFSGKGEKAGRGGRVENLENRAVIDDFLRAVTWCVRVLPRLIDAP